MSFDPNLGGHTAEMINLLAVMQMERFKPRYYIAAATDNMSLQKARALEDSLMDKVKYLWLLHAYDTLTVDELCGPFWVQFRHTSF